LRSQAEWMSGSHTSGRMDNLQWLNGQLACSVLGYNTAGNSKLAAGCSCRYVQRNESAIRARDGMYVRGHQIYEGNSFTRDVQILCCRSRKRSWTNLATTNYTVKISCECFGHAMFHCEQAQPNSPSSALVTPTSGKICSHQRYLFAACYSV